MEILLACHSADEEDDSSDSSDSQGSGGEHEQEQQQQQQPELPCDAASQGDEASGKKHSRRRRSALSAGANTVASTAAGDAEPMDASAVDAQPQRRRLKTKRTPKISEL